MRINVVSKPVSCQVKRLLSNTFSFNRRQGLKRFIQRNGGTRKPKYKVCEVITITNKYIVERQLCTQGNRDIVFCPSELEKALGVKILHISDICYYLLQEQVQYLFAQKALEASPNQDENPYLIDISSRDVEKIEELITSFEESPLVRYLCEKNLLLLFQSALNVDRRRRIFSYQDIHGMFLEYLKNNNHKFQNIKNPNLFFIKNDPLGGIVGMDWFSECQIKKVVKSLIIQCSP